MRDHTDKEAAAEAARKEVREVARRWKGRPEMFESTWQLYLSLDEPTQLQLLGVDYALNARDRMVRWAWLLALLLAALIGSGTMLWPGSASLTCFAIGAGLLSLYASVFVKFDGELQLRKQALRDSGFSDDQLIDLLMCLSIADKILDEADRVRAKGMRF